MEKKKEYKTIVDSPEEFAKLNKEIKDFAKANNAKIVEYGDVKKTLKKGTK